MNTGCGPRLMVATFLLLALPAAAIAVALLIVGQLYPTTWAAAPIADGLEFETDGRTYAIYESAAYASNVEVTDENRDLAQLDKVDEQLRIEDGRTFTRLADAKLDAGRYELRLAPSAFTNDEALIAYGDPPETVSNRRTGAIVLGMLAGIGLGGYLAAKIITGYFRSLRRAR